jgi:hypothetical protein
MKSKTISVTLVICSIAFWMILILKIPLFHSLPHWLWGFNPKALSNIWLPLLIIFVSALIVSFVLKYPYKTGINLILLILLGYFIQMSFGFMEGRGINGIRENLIIRGHAEFARLAAKEGDMFKIAKQYEHKIDIDQLGKYSPSKPPGTLLVYMAFQKLSNCFHPLQSEPERYSRFITFAAWLFPFICYLVLIPLYFFSRLFFNKKISLSSCIFFVFVPNVNLFTLNLDQVLFPTLFMICLFFGFYSRKYKSLIHAAIAGIIIYLTLYITFSLLPLIPLILFLFLIDYHGSDRKPILGSLKIMLIMIISFLLMDLIFRLLLNYDILIRFEKAMFYHENWNWKPSLKRTAYSAVLNYIEFVFWIGIPLAVLYLSNILSSIKEILKKEIISENLFSITVILIIILLGIFGKSMGETGRLWIFLVPLICMFASYEINKKYENKSDLAIKMFLALQFITIFILKIYNDY